MRFAYRVELSDEQEDEIVGLCQELRSSPRIFRSPNRRSVFTKTCSPKWLGFASSKFKPTVSSTIRSSRNSPWRCAVSRISTCTALTKALTKDVL